MMREVQHPSEKLLDLSAPLRTRDGRAVRLISSDCKVPIESGPYRYPVVAEVEHPNKPDRWVRWHYLRCGHWKSNDHCNGNDLINVARRAMH